MKSKLHELDKIGIFQRRFELITVSRFRDKTKIKKAAEAIDELRSKVRHDSNSSLSSAIRKWRDTRHGSSGS